MATALDAGDPAGWLVAHRGLAARAPENTLLSLERAVGAGARFLECDVQLTADGVPVLLHDATLARVAGRPGFAPGMTWDELSRESVHEPDRFGDRFAPLPPTRLDEVATLLRRHPDVELFVEMKKESAEVHGAGEVCLRVQEVLSEVWGRCVPISFDPKLVAEARSRGASRVGLVLRSVSARNRADAKALGPDFLVLNHRKVPPGSALWSGGWRWLLYEVTGGAMAAKLFERFRCMLETMDLERVLRELRPRRG